MNKKSLLCIAFFGSLACTPMLAMVQNFSNTNSTTDTNSSSYPGNYIYNGKIAWFLTIVAYKNVLASSYSLMAYGAGHRLVTRWNKQIDEKVSFELKEMEKVNVKLRKALADIITEFENGIGKEKSDYGFTLGFIEILNKNPCNPCIDEFVNIVSKNFTSDKADEASLNRDAFYAFSDRIAAHGCSHSDDEKLKNLGAAMFLPEIETSASSSYFEMLTAHLKGLKEYFFDDWNNPFHFSSLAWSIGGPLSTIGLAELLGPESRSGSKIGDYANLCNMIYILFAYPYSLGQQWKALDQTTHERMKEKFSKRLENDFGMIEIFARVVGKMDNDISIDTARSMLVLLIASGWEMEPVSYFVSVASKKKGSKMSKLFIMLDEISKKKEKKMPFLSGNIERLSKNFPMNEMNDSKDESDELKETPITQGDYDSRGFITVNMNDTDNNDI